MSFCVNVPFLEDTYTLALRLARLVQPQDVLTLRGDLGSGKTTFARFFIQTCLGKKIEVPSPTFTLVQLYEAPRFTIYHFDLYRLNSIEEIFSLDMDTAFYQGVSLIEWPELLGTKVLRQHLEINFSLTEPKQAFLTPDATWQARLESLEAVSGKNER